MNILCVGYRNWALRIYDKLASSYRGGNIFIIRNKETYNEEIISKYNPDVILFYGWSFYISKNIFSKYKCVMLHPSKLPKYRGGSPIQNQVMAGETASAVSLFLIAEGIDSGDILFQKDISLEGELSDIFNRMVEIGYEGTLEILNNNLKVLFEQDNEKATYCRRRKEEESEITIDELIGKSSTYLFNKIRMLADPYPNAFFKTFDGKKLVIKKVEIHD